MGLLDDAIKEHLELKRRRGADAGEISRLESEALGPVPRSAEGVPDMSDTFEPPRDAPAGDAAATPAAPPPSGLGEDDATAAHAPAPAPADEFLAPPHPSEHPPPVLPPAVAPPPQSLAPPSVPPPIAEPPPPSSAPPAREPWMTEDPGPEPEPALEPPHEPEPEHGGLFSRLRGGRRSRHDAEPERPSPAHELAPQDPEGFGPPPTPRPSAGPPLPGEHEPDIVPADDEPDGEELLEETPEFLEETPEHDRLWFEQRPPRDFNFDD